MNRFDGRRARRFRRARRADRGRAGARCCSSSSRAPSIRARRRARWTPGLGRARRARGRQARGLARATGSRWPTAADDATAWLSPDDDLRDAPAASRPAARRRRPGAAASPPTLRPGATSASARRRRGRCARLLVTGDSLSQPLDAELARAARAGSGVEVIRDPHLGTGHLEVAPRRLGQALGRAGREASGRTPSWSSSAPTRASRCRGADGETVECCGPDWAAAYANRVRRMMDTYRQGGDARVYWLTLPMPRDGRPPGDRPHGQRGDRRRGRSRTARRCACSTSCRSSRPRAVPRRDAGRRRARRSSASPTGST